MWKRFTQQNSTQYLKILPDIINENNNSYHSSIKISPVDASKKKNEGITCYNLYSNLKAIKKKQNLKLEIHLELLNTNKKHLTRDILKIRQKKYL